MKRLLSTNEAVEYLGVSRANFFALEISKQLLNMGWGPNKNLYDKKDLDDLIEERKKELRKRQGAEGELTPAKVAGIK